MGYGAKIIEEIVVRYQDLKWKESNIKLTRTTTNYNSAGGGRSSSRNDPTAQAALRELSKQERAEISAIEYAIKQTYRYEDGTDRMRAIMLLYWKGTCRTVEEVSEIMGIPIYYLNLYRMDFFHAVAQKLELTPCAGCVFWREYMPGYKGCHHTYDMNQTRIRAIDGSCLSKSTEVETLEQAWWWRNGSAIATNMERKRANEREKKAASL